jgi:hypothetical protein
MCTRLTVEITKTILMIPEEDGGFIYKAFNGSLTKIPSEEGPKSIKLTYRKRKEKLNCVTLDYSTFNKVR